MKYGLKVLYVWGLKEEKFFETKEARLAWLDKNDEEIESAVSFQNVPNFLLDALNSLNTNMSDYEMDMYL
jgi:hypothetical protein